MRHLFLIAFILSVNMASAQNIFVPDPSYDYSNNEVLEGVDTATDIGTWLIVEQIGLPTTSTTSLNLYSSTGSSFTFNVISATVDASDILTWAGSCTDPTYPDGIAIITVKDGMLGGNIKLNSTTVSGLLSIGDDHYVIYEHTEDATDCGSPAYTSSAEPTGGDPGARFGLPCDGFFYYKLVLAYTPQFAASFGNDQAQINAYLEDIMVAINHTYEFSILDIRARMAFSYMTSESESGDIEDDYNDFLFDGIFHTKFNAVVDNLNRFSGDAAVLLVTESKPDVAGVGSNFPHNRGIYTKNGAAGQNGIGGWGVAHEIGHMFGLDHNIEEYNFFGRAARIFKNAYGYRGNNFRCVMSYQNANQTREPLYSTPDLLFNDLTPAGNSKARGRYYLNDHMFNLVSDDPDHLVLTSYTYTSDQASNLFAYVDITFNNVTVSPQSMVHLRAPEKIFLKPGVKIRAGSEFYAKIESCGSAIGARMAASQITAQPNPSVANPAPEPEPEKKPKAEQVFNELNVFPNPSSSGFKVSLSFQKPTEVRFLLRDINGHVLQESTEVNVVDFNKSIETGVLPKGVYIVETKTPTKSQFKKVIVQ